jgi:5-hydroxyisourate hydrolase-like protein (transthyretin family)
MKVRCLFLGATVLSSSLVLGAAPPGEAPSSFVDDRGVAIDALLTARLLAPPQGVTQAAEQHIRLSLPREWTGLVEIEGEGYGPIRGSADELRSHSGPLVVPRKALLRVSQAADGAYSLSYFPIVDATLVATSSRDVSAAAPLRVPSGAGLLVAKRSEGSREFRLLNLLPGSTTDFVPRFSPVYAALLRVQRLVEGTPVARAVVRVAQTEGEHSGEAKTRRLCESDKSGLCLVVSTEPQVAAVVEAEGLVPIRCQFALTADYPREVELVKMNVGARPMFQVLLDGEAAHGVPLQLRRTGAAAAGEPSDASKVFSAIADDEGRWIPGVVPPGSWILRVRPEKGQPPFEKRIELRPGSVDRVEVNLERIRITGALSRGKKGIPGATIVIAPGDVGERNYSTASHMKEQEIVTDSEGEFEAFVWRVGVYSVFAGGLARKTVPVPRTGTRVSLRVAENDLVCVVIDENGRPIPSASVTLKEAEQGQSWTKTVKTDSEGRTKFSVRDGSEITVSATAVGFKRSEKATSSVPAEGVVSPIILRLERDSVLVGRFVGPSGRPIQRADVWAVSPAGEVLRSSSATDGEGRFEISRAGGREFTVFFVSAEAALTTHVVYDVGQNEELVFPSTETGTLEVQFSDSKGAPIPARSAVLEKSGVVIQPALLSRHLALRRLTPFSDARGTLLIPDLPTGDWVVVVPDVPSPERPGPLRAKTFVAPGLNRVRITLEELATKPPL